MLFNKTEDLTATVKLEVPGHATAICFYVGGTGEAELLGSPDGTTFYEIASVTTGNVEILTTAFPFVKYTVASGTPVVKLGISTHKHGS